MIICNIDSKISIIRSIYIYYIFSYLRGVRINRIQIASVVFIFNS